jgi:putative oxidoreductase
MPNEKLLQLIGRALVGFIYLGAGIEKIPNWSPTLAMMHAEGMPFAELFLVAAIIMLIGGGLGVLLGFKTRAAALTLAIFTIPAMLIFNHFWSMELPRALDIQHLFLSNVVMLGACLFIAGNGPGAWALDNRATV